MSKTSIHPFRSRIRNLECEFVRLNIDGLSNYSPIKGSPINPTITTKINFYTVLELEFTPNST